MNLSEIPRFSRFLILVASIFALVVATIVDLVFVGVDYQATETKFVGAWTCLLLLGLGIVITSIVSMVFLCSGSDYRKIAITIVTGFMFTFAMYLWMWFIWTNKTSFTWRELETNFDELASLIKFWVIFLSFELAIAVITLIG